MKTDKTTLDMASKRQNACILHAFCKRQNACILQQVQVDSDPEDEESDIEDDNSDEMQGGEADDRDSDEDFEPEPDGTAGSSEDDSEEDNPSDSPNDDETVPGNRDPQAEVFISKDSKERWTARGPAAHQARAQNVVKGKPGPTAFAKQRVSEDNMEVDCFLVFFSQRMIDHVLECTNREGNRVKKEEWTVVNEMELRAFFGLLLLRGVYKASGESTEELWSEDGRKDFPATMSYNRFVCI